MKHAPHAVAAVDFLLFLTILPYCGDRNSLIIALLPLLQMKHAPHVVAAVDFFERVSCVVATEILRGFSPRDRALVIAKWLKVAETLRNMRSFQALAGELEEKLRLG